MSTTFVDHYAVLGVPPAASPQRVRGAYMLLAKLYHPDMLGAHSDCADPVGRFAAITGSYAVLKNETKRKKFDAECKLLKKILVCSTCAGTGRRMLQKGFGYTESVECKSCGGTGRNEQPAKL